MELDAVMVNTPSCFHCGLTGQVNVMRRDLERWQGGELIQRAFPEMTPDVREQMISGTHPECWDAMMGEVES